MRPTHRPSDLVLVTIEEVRDVIFRMGWFKARERDGFQAILYISNWKTIGPTIYNMVREIMIILVE